MPSRRARRSASPRPTPPTRRPSCGAISRWPSARSSRASSSTTISPTRAAPPPRSSPRRSGSPRRRRSSRSRRPRSPPRKRRSRPRRRRWRRRGSTCPTPTWRRRRAGASRARTSPPAITCRSARTSWRWCRRRRGSPPISRRRSSTSCAPGSPSRFASTPVPTRPCADMSTASNPAAARPSPCCRRRMRRATTSRWCSASRSRSSSTIPLVRAARSAPACRWCRASRSSDLSGTHGVSTRRRDRQHMADMTLAPAAPSAPAASPWLVAPTVGIAAFMEVLDISIANVALQHIAGSLSATPDEATWVLTSYLVTNAIILPVSGWLSATIGRKRYFLGCIIGFSITSLLCGLAPSLWLLILARGLQGVTGGGLQPVAPAILPTLGGWITDNFDWRWVFLLNVPVGVFLTLLATRVLADSPAEVARRKARLAGGISLDYVGFALLVIGMGALQIVLDKGQEDDWFSSSFITGFAITAMACLAGFVVWELRRADPIVDLRLLKRANFAIGSVLMFVLGFILLGSTVLLPLMVQTLFGYNATDAGMVLSPGGFAIMLMMPVVGNLVAKVDPRWLIAVGLVATSLALSHMTNFDLDIDYGTVAWARVFQSVGLAFLFIPINTVAFLGVPPERSGNASAIINMMRNIGGSFGIALATTLVARRAQYHQSMLVEHVRPFSSQYDETIQRMQQAFLSSSANAADALQKAQALLYATVQKQAAMLSYIDSFWALGVLAMVLVPLVFVMRKPRPGAAAPPAH